MHSYIHSWCTVLCRYKAGTPLSVLDGVPYVVKDCTDALPYATNGGTTYVRSSGLNNKLHALILHCMRQNCIFCNTHSVRMSTTHVSFRALMSSLSFFYAWQSPAQSTLAARRKRSEQSSSLVVTPRKNSCMGTC